MNAKHFLPIFFAIGVLMLSVHIAFSQDYLIHNYSELDGLANSKVTGVTQDFSGRMWFATRGGISVYDGATWKSYTQADELPVPAYAKIKLDEKGIIWAIPDAQISYIPFFYNNKWNSNIKLPVDLPPIVASCFEVIYINDAPLLALGTYDQGILFFHKDQWLLKTKADGLPSNCINGIVGWQGQFFIATDSGMVVYKNGGFNNNLFDKFTIPHSHIIGIALENEVASALSDLKIWLLGEYWLGYIQHDLFTLLSDEIIIKRDDENHYFNLAPDKKGGVYFGNFFQMLHFNYQTRSTNSLGVQNGLVSNGISALFLDRENNLWISSTRGVSKIVSRQFANYCERHGLLEDEVTAILEYEPGKYVFGHNSGLTFYNGSTYEHLRFPHIEKLTRAEIRVLDLAVDYQKNIWVAASHLGLAKMDAHKRITWLNEKVGLEGSITSILIHKFNEIWISNYSGIFILEGKKFEKISTTPLPPPVVRKIVKAPDNSILLATRGGGIYHFKNGIWKQYKSNVAPADNNIYSILVDSKNRILVGANSGLQVVENDSLTRFNLGAHQVNRPVYVILEDRQKRLWFGTDNGVIRWDGKNYQHFTGKEGFVGRETNRAAGLIDSQGRIWIGSDKGISCFLEEYEIESNMIPAPLVEINYLNVAGREVNIDQPNRLRYNEDDWYFSFQGISFIDEKEINLKFKLEGFDSDWHMLPRTAKGNARYTNLSPGKYQFHVQAQNIYGQWSQEKISNLIFIAKPFWSTWWFFLISFLAFMVIAASLYQSQMHKHHAVRLEKQVLERTAQLQESEQQYRTTIDAMADAIHVVDQDLKVLLYNKTLYNWNKKLGLETDLLGKSILELYPFLPRKVEGEYRQVFKKAKSVVTQEKNILDSVEIITETRKIPIMEKGKVMRVLTVLSDITDRQKVDERIRESEEKYRSVVENSYEAIVVVQEGMFRFFNSRTLEITGYSADELSATPFTELIHPDDKTAVLERHLRRLKGEEFSKIYSFRIIDKNQQVKWLLLNAVLISWEGKPATLNFLSDITELKKAEEDLKRKAEFERLISETSTEFINLSPENLDDGINHALQKIGQFVQVDRSYVFLFHEKAKIMNNTHEWCAPGIEPQIDNLQGLPFEAAPWWMAKINRLDNIYIHRVADLPAEATNEKEILEAQDIQSLIVVPLIYGGSAIGFLGFDLVRCEKEWSEGTIALLRMVGDVFVNAIKQKENAEKILASLHEKEILLREIHHRVKNNLQVVSSILYLQSKNLKNKKMLNILQESQNRVRAMAMVHEKLYQSANIANFDFSEYIRDLAVYLFRTYAKNGHAIDLKMDIQQIALDIETAIPCGLILNELVSNAVKYAFPNNRSGNIVIQLFSDEHENYNFIVKDNGVGMSKEISLENTDSLGLRLVNSLAAQLQAKLTLNRDHGTSFEIIFPAKRNKKRIK